MKKNKILLEASIIQFTLMLCLIIKKLINAYPNRHRKYVYL